MTKYWISCRIFRFDFSYNYFKNFQVYQNYAIIRPDIWFAQIRISKLSLIWLTEFIGLLSARPHNDSLHHHVLGVAVNVQPPLKQRNIKKGEKIQRMYLVYPAKSPLVKQVPKDGGDPSHPFPVLGIPCQKSPSGAGPQRWGRSFPSLPCTWYTLPKVPSWSRSPRVRESLSTAISAMGGIRRPAAALFSL